MLPLILTLLLAMTGYAQGATLSSNCGAGTTLGSDSTDAGFNVHFGTVPSTLCTVNFGTPIVSTNSTNVQCTVNYPEKFFISWTSTYCNITPVAPLISLAGQAPYVVCTKSGVQGR